MNHKATASASAADVDSSLRRRGWSIMSESDLAMEPVNTTRTTSTAATDIIRRRSRADTDQTEDTNEKMQLLEHFPSDEEEEEESEVEAGQQHDTGDAHSEAAAAEEDEESSSSSSYSYSDLFPQDDSLGKEEEEDGDRNKEDKDQVEAEVDAPPAKRRRVTVDTNSFSSSDKPTAADTNTNSSSTHDLNVMAKKKLSKWALRLFDSSRPKGLIETPPIIPLNDEYLKAFGQRHVQEEKQILQRRKHHVWTNSSNDASLHDDHKRLESETVSSALSTQQEQQLYHNNKAHIQIENKDEINYPQQTTTTIQQRIHGMVTIVNIAYTTTLETIFKTCERYGPVLKIDLPMDMSSPSTVSSSIPTKSNSTNPDGIPKPIPTKIYNPSLNLGKATVIFEYPDDAARFVECRNQQIMDGRLIGCFLVGGGGTTTGATTTTTSSSTTINNNTTTTDYKPSTTYRYFTKDISTKCFRCGQIGHTQGSCTNPEKPKPCPLCTMLLTAEHDTTGHYYNLKACPLSKVCFNCGSPGHINKTCPYKKFMPKRVVCTACLMEGHHRWSCPNKVVSTIPCAKCITCGMYFQLLCLRVFILFIKLIVVF